MGLRDEVASFIEGHGGSSRGIRAAGSLYRLSLEELFDVFDPSKKIPTTEVQLRSLLNTPLLLLGRGVSIDTSGIWLVPMMQMCLEICSDSWLHRTMMSGRHLSVPARPVGP